MDLMEYAAECCGGILSNLKYVKYRAENIDPLLAIDDEAYSMAEWNYLVSYISGREMQMATPTEAKRWLANRFRRKFG